MLPSVCCNVALVQHVGNMLQGIEHCSISNNMLLEHQRIYMALLLLPRQRTLPKCIVSDYSADGKMAMAYSWSMEKTFRLIEFYEGNPCLYNNNNNNNTQIAAIALPPSTTHPQLWAELLTFKPKCTIA